MLVTGVRGTAAEHLTLRNANGTTSELTLIWSTRRQECDRGLPGELGHASIEYDADTLPAVDDPTGCGDWQVSVAAQCGADGAVLVPRAVLLDGHADEDAVREAARRVAEWVAEDEEAAREEVRAELRERVEVTRAAIYDGEDVRLRDADYTDPYVVGIDADGHLTAWAYDPAGGEGDILVYTEGE